MIALLRDRRTNDEKEVCEKEGVLLSLLIANDLGETNENFDQRSVIIRLRIVRLDLLEQRQR